MAFGRSGCRCMASSNQRSNCTMGSGSRSVSFNSVICLEHTDLCDRADGRGFIHLRDRLIEGEPAQILRLIAVDGDLLRRPCDGEVTYIEVAMIRLAFRCRD